MNSLGRTYLSCLAASASRGVSVLGLPFAAFAFFLLNACTFTDPYPASWGALSTPLSEDCRHVEGNYSNPGESAGSSDHPWLTWVLFGQSLRATRVNLSLPRNGVLEVTGWENTDRVFSQTLTTQAGEFACEKGLLVVRRRHWVHEGQAVARSEFTIELAAAGDDLVAKMTESAIGLAVVVPVAGTLTRWYRFAHLRD